MTTRPDEQKLASSELGEDPLQVYTVAEGVGCAGCGTYMEPGTRSLATPDGFYCRPCITHVVAEFDA
jgi:hypothetical protein